MQLKTPRVEVMMSRQLSNHFLLGTDPQIEDHCFPLKAVQDKSRTFFDSAAAPPVSENTLFMALQLLRDLSKRVKVLEKQIKEISAIETITLRDISYKEAKAEIRQLFKNNHGKSFDPSDIESTLSIDIEMAILICDELEKEGKINSL